MEPSPAAAAAEDRATFAQLAESGEFRALWVAHILSHTGDELATIALALLVYQRTESAFLVALTVTLSFLPYAIVGPLLSGLADRLPRRGLMVACDLIRAGLVLVMLVPGIPLWALWALLFAMMSCESPFSSARAATMPDLLPGDRYVLGSAVMNVTAEVSRFAGAAAGGVLVAVFSPATALVIDAGTFLLSAALIRFCLRHRPAVRDSAEAGHSWSGIRDVALLLVRHPYLRALTLLGLLGAFYAVPRGLAVPFVADAGGRSPHVGLLLAADPAGTIVGALLIGRMCSPSRRLALMGPLAVLSCAPLMLSWLPIGIWPVFLLWMLAGFGTAYNLPANAAFVATVPLAQRGQAFALVTSAMAATQGAAVLLAGAVATVVAPGAVIAASGAIGTVLAVLLARSLRRLPVS